jgi:hypothetical protein
MSKTFASIAILLFMCLACSWIIALYALSSPQGLRAACALVQRHLSLKVEIGASSHAPGTVGIEDTTLETPDGVLIKIPSLQVTYDLFSSLIHRRIEIDLLEVRNPTVRLQGRLRPGRDTGHLSPGAASGESEGRGGGTEGSAEAQGEGDLLARAIEEIVGRLRTPKALQGAQNGRKPPPALSEKSATAGGGLGLPVPVSVEQVRVQDAAIWYSEESPPDDVHLEQVGLRGSFSSRPLRGAFVLEAGTLRWHRFLEEAGSIQARAVLEGETLGVESLQITYPAFLVSARGGLSLASGSLRGSILVDRVPLERLLQALGVGLVPVDWVSGALEVEGEGFSNVVFDADLHGHGYGQGLHAAIQGTYRGGVLEIPSVQVRADEGTLRGGLRWDPDRDEIEGLLSADSPGCSRVFEALGLSGFEAEDVSGHANLAGKRDEIEVTVELRARRALFHSVPFEGIDVRLAYRGTDRFSVTASIATVPLGTAWKKGWRIQGSGAPGLIEARLIGPPGLRLDVRARTDRKQAEADIRVDGLDIAPLASMFFGGPLEVARVSGTGRVRFAYEGLFSGEGAAAVAGLRDGIEGDLVLTDVSLTSKDLSVSNGNEKVALSMHEGRLYGQASLAVNRGYLRLSGSVPLLGTTAKGELQVETAAALDVQPLQPIIARYLPVPGTLEGRLRFETNLRGRPEALNAKGSLHLDEAVWVVRSAGPKGPLHPGREIVRAAGRLEAVYDGPIRSPTGSLTLFMDKAVVFGIPVRGARAEIVSDGARVFLKPTDLVTNGGIVSLEGTLLTADGTVSGTLRSSAIDLGKVVPADRARLGGTLLVRGAIQGRLDRPRVSLETPIENLVWGETALGRLDAALSLADRTLVVTASAPAGTIKGSLRTDGENPFCLEAALQKMPLDPFFGLAGLSDVRGEVTARARVEGALFRPEDSSGTILCQEVLAARDSYRITNQKPITLSLDRGRLGLDRCDLTLNEYPLSLEGTLWKDLDLSVSGTVPVELANNLVPGVYCSSGRARIDARIRAGQEGPVDLQGALDLTATHLVVPYYPYPLESVSAVATFDGRRVHFVSVTGELGNGSVSVTGSLGWSPPAFEQLSAVIRSIPYRIPETLEATWSGLLTLSGDVSSSLLSGTVRIERARYFRDIEIAGEVLGLRKPKIALTRKHPEVARNMALDVRIEGGPDLVVKNNLAGILLWVDLRLMGSAADPVPQGFVKVVEGRVYYSEKQFEIVDGHLEYSGQPGSEPLLHISSRVDVRGQSRDYEVFLDLDGPLDRIRLSLRSVPELEQEDIVFLLLTGQTQSEYFAASAAGGETTRQLAFMGLTSLLGGRVKSLTGVDTFVMEATKGKELGMKTTFGKHVSERIDVRGILNVGSAKGVNEAQVQYRLTDTLYLVGTQRSDGTFGLDVRIRYQGD